jgi:ketosteroid isomerase-like protein
MKSFFTFVLVAFSLIVRAQSADEQAVIATEKQRFAAQVSRDYDALGKLLADDLVYTHSNGNTDNKQTYIQTIRDGKFRYEQIDVAEQRVRLYGDVALINGICQIKATNNGEPTNLKLKYTDAYIRRHGQWQLITWQSLRLQ